MTGQGHSDPEEMSARLLQTLYFQTKESNVILCIKRRFFIYLN
jgi:hypothetical protein